SERAPRSRAWSTAAPASARLTPRRRKPMRVTKHVTARHRRRSDPRRDQSTARASSGNADTPYAARSHTNPPVRPPRTPPHPPSPLPADSLLLFPCGTSLSLPPRAAPPHSLAMILYHWH